MFDYFHCRSCRTRVALIQDYDPIVNDLVIARFFTRVFNVEVAEDERYHPVIDGMNLAETYCVQCKNLLGWKLIAVSQPSRSHRVGGFYMKLKDLSFWNDETLPNFLFGGDNEQAPNDQDGGADEEQDHNQNGGANEENADQDGDSNEQNADQDGDTNEHNADQDGDADEQDLGANEQNAKQDKDANETEVWGEIMPKFGVYGSLLGSDQLVFQPITPHISQKLPLPTRISSHKPIKIRIRVNSAAPKSSDLHIASEKTHCPELTSGDNSPIAPFIIQGDLIHYSTCRKWRLLPYGTKPDQLSQSWICSMLDWLPGMNCCDISEDDTTSALYQSIIQSNFQNGGGKGSIDVKAHKGREVSVKKRKLREQDCLDNNDLGVSDANAFERRFRKKKKSSTSKGEGKSRTRDKGIKDSPPIEREYQTKK